MTELELAPCPTPWCAAHFRVAATRPYIFERRKGIVGVCCPNCCVSTTYCETEAEAVKQWNTRPPVEIGEALGEVVSRAEGAARLDAYAAGCRVGELAAADKLEALSGRISTARDALEFAEERLGLISATAYTGPAKRYGDHAREALTVVQAALAQTQSEG